MREREKADFSPLMHSYEREWVKFGGGQLVSNWSPRRRSDGNPENVVGTANALIAAHSMPSESRSLHARQATPATGNEAEDAARVFRSAGAAAGFLFGRERFLHEDDLFAD